MFSISPSALLRYTRSLQEAVATQVVALLCLAALCLLLIALSLRKTPLKVFDLS